MRAEIFVEVLAKMSETTRTTRSKQPHNTSSTSSQALRKDPTKTDPSGPQLNPRWESQRLK